ncbi:endonuclease/exonuclease/phosphatase family protein [Microbacterium sp.]|uniref:endonuclease/exonuclease/phosphatase family protein n=1 Tax=Microbacterium sp. TaxID=51671 RepID=UPI003C72F96D
MAARARPRVGFAVALVVSAPVGLLLCWPQALGAQTWLVVAQVLSFRVVVAVTLILLALLLAVLALLRGRVGAAAGIAVVCALAGVTSVAVLAARGWHGELPPAGRDSGDVVVAAWNTQYGGADPASVARLVMETDADIVSLPETGERVAGETAQLLADEGKQLVPHTTYGDDSPLPTSVLIASDLGAYRLDDAAGSTPRIPSGAWVPIDGVGPVIVAAHTMPPLPSAIDDWRAGLEWVRERCSGNANVILAGDLNATLDHLHSFLGGCRDTAAEAGGAATGSWTTMLPTWLATPIDHVLVGEGWRVRGARVLTSFDDAGSDHRPIVAVLARR